MSHLHIPDGIIAIWLWVLGYVLTAVYFFIFARHIKKTSSYKKIPVVSVLGALMLLSMSIPVPFFLPYHINLSSLAGILVGPFYAGSAIFCVNMILALLGHGGVTIIGLNTVILTIEAGIAYFLYKKFKSAFTATFCALIVSAFLTITVIYLGTHDLDLLLDCHECAGGHEHEAVFSPDRFLLMVLAVGAMGWTLESFITNFIVNYIKRVKPELLEKKE
ncbi:MAG: hypothetical protein A2Y25_08375 [Candidatus Melainabacteria bacterium GWF2_37_15]|nr:MAG: hypothetical protein A2Y25_08375 [Candidatus Melainabacteria bacterium GWF2_37_15]